MAAPGTLPWTAPGRRPASPRGGARRSRGGRGPPAARDHRGRGEGVEVLLDDLGELAVESISMTLPIRAARRHKSGVALVEVQEAEVVMDLRLFGSMPRTCFQVASATGSPAVVLDRALA